MYFMFMEASAHLPPRECLAAEVRREMADAAKAQFETEVEKRWPEASDQEYERLFRLLIEEVNKNS